MAERANIFTIPPGADFAKNLARGLIARLDTSDPFALSRATIYLPTQRAARVFGDAFAAESGGAALLPNFRPLGDVDEDEMLFDSQSDPFELPPAISSSKRRFILAQLVRQWHQAEKKEHISFAQAASLAGGLADVMDDMERQGAKLSHLGDLVKGNLAEHWQKVVKFLGIVEKSWPKILREEGLLNPADRRNKALATLAKRLKTKAPEGFVIAAGSTGSIPATAELLSVIARLPKGAVILPGLDQSLDRASWDAVGEDPGHPQFGMRQLLNRMHVAREDVAVWDEAVKSPRNRLLSETLRPAPVTDAWQKLVGSETKKEIEAGLTGLKLIEANDPAEEARVVALLLRETLEDKSKTAALITPDRTLGRRVASELRRFNIAIDDSGGTPLAHTPPGAFLCLLAEAAQEGFPPVKLLALLKHPFAANGQARSDFLFQARRLDHALRGPRPDAGLAGLADAILRAEEEHGAKPEIFHQLKIWFEELRKSLAPFADLLMQDEAPLFDLLEAHIACAEALGHDGRESLLWRGPAAAALTALVGDLREAASGITVDTAYAALFRTLAEEKSLRPPYGSHPRLSILGPLEARLLSFDRVILGGLNEGAWPRHASPDPWFSRPMRKDLGLEQPERAIGLSAHDFAQSAAGTDVFLTRAQKAEGTPTVASRWVQRLVQLTKGLNLHQTIESEDYLRLARTLAAAPSPRRIAPPYPKPPVSARPRKLSVTRIETLFRDPYAIYAQYVLHLRKLDPLEAEIGALERGNTLHKIMEIFVQSFDGTLPPDAANHLFAIADRVFREERTPQANLAVWKPRFQLAVKNLIKHEVERRANIAKSHVEIEGGLTFSTPGGEFTLTAKADRIDVLKSGGAAILDYKSGNPPTEKQVKEIVSPQLLLEGAILKAGGFEKIGKVLPAEIIYVGFAGREPGIFKALNVDVTALTIEAETKLKARIALYDNPDVGYASRLMPYRQDIVGDYDHLARAQEWSQSGEDGE